MPRMVRADKSRRAKHGGLGQGFQVKACRFYSGLSISCQTAVAGTQGPGWFKAFLPAYNPGIVREDMFQ